MKKREKKFLSTTEVAQLLGISRVAVFKRIKKGTLPAQKRGRQYAISKKDLGLDKLHSPLSQKRKNEIERDISYMLKRYRKTFELLGKDD